MERLAQELGDYRIQAEKDIEAAKNMYKLFMEKGEVEEKKEDEVEAEQEQDKLQDQEQDKEQDQEQD